MKAIRIKEAKSLTIARHMLAILGTVPEDNIRASARSLLHSNSLYRLRGLYYTVLQDQAAARTDSPDPARL
jgi:hypothetical protein